jgi:hypothetical protein
LCLTNKTCELSRMSLTMSTFANKMQRVKEKVQLNSHEILYILQGCCVNMTYWSVHVCTTTSLGERETRLMLNIISLLVLIAILYWKIYTRRTSYPSVLRWSRYLQSVKSRFSLNSSGCPRLPIHVSAVVGSRALKIRTKPRFEPVLSGRDCQSRYLRLRLLCLPYA